MVRLSIRHETLYAYERAVGFKAQRLLVRPRDSHALRLVDASLELSPKGLSRWTYDALGNCVCWFTPETRAERLSIVSNLVIDRFPAFLEPQIDDPHSALPIVYSLSDRIVLAPFTAPATEDAHAAITGWLRGYVGHPSEPALFFIQRLNSAIHRDFEYGHRLEEGVQSPAQTLALRAGTCRDFAWLMVEALRRVGFAARFVTGYLYSPRAGVRGAGATHAWCEVFLPGLGWTEFDPTNDLAESADLIPVAAARTPAEAAPISGGLLGDPGLSTLHVDVQVALVDPAPAPPEPEPWRPKQMEPVP